MKSYIFKTTATMKEYNCAKWWIDGNIISDKYIKAANLTEALKKYSEMVEEHHYISISQNALKTKQPMYIDSKDGVIQKGFVITAKSDFESDTGWKQQYIDLWIEILTVVKTDFTE